ncbi:hypothetical protein [Bradyrhizobium uaiense]|uniref:Nucleotidyl transferase domain-containing protein n=1 Tax=Bradyrhizobium uaiense TaxID=2594946 RepID=A0A6P1BHP3_9BRAD|nr:hypothetical protein [Bradyrhizobium uaiense]NEU97997.1 hypothetical protein [Bradyrhizobium uaiense]
MNKTVKNFEMLNGTRAVILATGMVLRQRPYPELVPTLLVDTNRIPMLHNGLHQLSVLGIGEAAVAAGYRKEAIEQFCGQRLKNIEIEYARNPIFEQRERSK